MLDKCANPRCAITFDYKQGRFFRFHRPCVGNEPPVNVHSVQHFWLCGHCAKTNTLHYNEQQGVGVLVGPRLSVAHHGVQIRVIRAA